MTWWWVDVSAPPFTWHSVAAALYGPHGNCQQHDAISHMGTVSSMMPLITWELSAAWCHQSHGNCQQHDAINHMGTVNSMMPSITWELSAAWCHQSHGNCQQHDAINQSPHCVQDQPNAMKWEVLKYQTYSSNLSPCVLHMLGLLQKTLMMDDVTDEAVIQCSRQQLKDFYTDKICSTCASK
jgi:hypothetical protein